VVNSLVKDILTPIIAAIFGQPDFSQLTFTIHRARFFFLVVKPINYLTERGKKVPDPESVDRACPECPSSIPKEARRCAFCTAEVTPVV
jgi:large conductance mechanosensitive channel